MLQKSRLGQVNSTSPVKKFFKRQTPTSILIFVLVLLITLIYLSSSPTPLEPHVETIESKQAAEATKANAREFFQKMEATRRARDADEHSIQTDLLRKYKAAEATKKREEPTQSLLSSYAPTPQLVPAHLELIDLALRGSCIPKDSCQKCTSDPSCPPSGYRASFVCTPYIANNNAAPRPDGLPEAPEEEVTVSCEFALVDGRQAFWTVMALCGAGAVLGAAWFKSRLHTLIVQ